MLGTLAQLPAAVTDLLARLRRRIRWYVWWEGLCAAIAWLGTAFWLSLGIDWFFEPPVCVRVGMLVGAMAVLAGIVVQMILRRLWVPLGDSSLALLIERHYPQFEESLVTAVELTGPRPALASAALTGAGGDWSFRECDPAMLARTCRLAAEPIAQVALERLLNPTPLRRAMAAAVLLLFGVGMYALVAPGMFAVWVHRQLLFSEELWPRMTRLVVEGFDESNDYRVKVAKGSDFEVIAKADLSWPRVPQVVQLHCWAESGSPESHRSPARHFLRLPRIASRGGGAFERRTMSREGAADPASDQFQRYSPTFRSLLVPIRFDVIGGDDAVRGLRIEVVDNPTIVKMELQCQYPGYTLWPPQTLPVVESVMAIPAGTTITIRAKTNKDLVRVQMQVSREDDSKLERAAVSPPNLLNPRTFECSIQRLMEDTTLLFTLWDADGIKSREPIRLTLARLDDKPPELKVQLCGIGPAITPRAVLPALGKVTDDYGIARMWFEHTIDQHQPARTVVSSPKENLTELPIKHSLDVRPLGLNPGRKLAVVLKASDRCEFAGGPNIGSSQRWVLDVVTPEQLRAMLEQREIALRQRFAAILQEVSETRDSLGRVAFASAKPAEAAPAKPAEREKRPEQSEQHPTADQLAAERTSRVHRAMQYALKNAKETLGVAEAFDDIREELINNRIDTEELRIRLRERIVQPLRHIEAEMFPELTRRLEQLLATINDSRLGGENCARAIQQLDLILVAMRQVLDQMVELKDSNEMVDRLRTIIRDQETLHELLKQRHKQSLRELREK